MVMALRALDGDAQNAFTDRIHTVEHRFHAELLWIDAAFFVNHGIAQKAGRNDLFLRGVRQFVAGNLVDDELVVGQVAVECVDHPVAIKPNPALLIFFITVGIGVARGVQP